MSGKSDKYLFCSECKCMPDRIQEDFDWYRMIRIWDGSDYVEATCEYGDSQLTCEKCGTTLVEAPPPKVEG